MSRPPTVLHVITTVSRGGAENHLFDLVRQQCALGMKVGVAWLKEDAYWADALRKCGAEVLPLEMGFYGDPFPVFRLRKYIEGKKVDVVHAHLPPAEVYARLAIVGRPEILFLISKHNDAPFFDLPGADWLGRAVGQRAVAAIAISEAVRQNVLLHRLNMAPTKTRTIHYGLESEERVDWAALDSRAQQWRASWCQGREELLVGCVARFVPQKNHGLLLDAFRRFSRLARQPCRLVLVGRGPLLPEIKAKAKALGLEEWVTFAGFIEDIPAVMRAFDILCLTSNYEGFGLVLLEAMAAERPIVATRVSSIPEIVVDNETGLLIAPGSVHELEAALLRLSDPGLRERMGHAARRRLEAHFSNREMAERYHALYAGVMQKGGKGA